MTSVRPPIFPPSQAAQPGRPNADPARLAAQKAFFDLAMGKTAAPRAAAPTSPSAAPATAASATRLPHPDSEKPQKILRPGSLLDIRV